MLIDWLAVNLLFHRPIKTKNLYLYGPTSTQKSLIVNFLAKVINISFVNARKTDFAEVCDLGVWDEFQIREKAGGNIELQRGPPVEGTSSGNAPVLMISNKLPSSMGEHGPRRICYNRLRFSTRMGNLREERIIATLYGCMIRRSEQARFSNPDVTTNEDISLDCNRGKAIIVPFLRTEKQKEKRFEWKHRLFPDLKPETEVGEKSPDEPKRKNFEAALLTSAGKFYPIRLLHADDTGVLIINILAWDGKDFGRRNENKGNSKQISLLDFATIPIAKVKPEGEEEVP